VAGSVRARIERFVDLVGEWTSWLALVIVALMATNVLLRYLFSTGSVWAQELEWHLLAPLILFGSSYALRHGAHVRVDIIYARLVPQKRALVDLVCGLLFLFPTCFLLVMTAIPFVVSSLSVLEGSPDPGGLPARYLLKMAIPAGFLLLGLQGVSELVKNFAAVRGGKAGA